jgi:hypothetical protein
LEETYEIIDTKEDMLSHTERKNQVHILTLDHILATDIYARIHYDSRMSNYRLIRPRKADVEQTVEEIESMVKETINSRLLIIDVRRLTLPKLQWAYNTIVGYNRKDINKLCYVILIGDGPWDLFREGRNMDVFVPYLSRHRMDFYPALFYFDPLIHYRADEVELSVVGEKFTLPDKIPQRLVPYFRQDQEIGVDKVRSYFRAVHKDEQEKKRRRRRLKNLYKKRIAEQFPEHVEEYKLLLTKQGLQLASEKLHLYPLYFEDWVYKLMLKAKRRAAEL